MRPLVYPRILLFFLSFPHHHPHPIPKLVLQKTTIYLRLIHSVFETWKLEEET